MQPSLKRKLLAGTVVATVAAFTGGAYAASQALNDNSRQAFLSDVAKRLNVTPAQLDNALKGAYQDQLQAAVKAGKITQAQANAIQQRMAKNPGAPLWFFGPGFHRGFGGRGFAFGGPRGGALSAAAQYLGLTDAQLSSRLALGKSLAQIAKAQGKSTTELKAKMIAAITVRLDKLRTAGIITAAAEKQMLSTISSRLDAEINAAGGRGQFRFQQVHPRAAGGYQVLPGAAAGTVPGFVPGGPPAGYPGAGTLGGGQVQAPASGPVS